MTQLAVNTHNCHIKSVGVVGTSNAGKTIREAERLPRDHQLRLTLSHFSRNYPRMLRQPLAPEDWRLTEESVPHRSISAPGSRAVSARRLAGRVGLPQGEHAGTAPAACRHHRSVRRRFVERSTGPRRHLPRGPRSRPGWWCRSFPSSRRNGTHPRREVVMKGRRQVPRGLRAPWVEGPRRASDSRQTC